MTKEVNKALDSFNSLYKNGGIVNLAKNPRYPDKVLTGRPSIDYLTDGGFPKGRLILIAGEPSSGKSSLTIQIANLVGKKVLYADTEMTLTSDYIEQLGASLEKFDHFIPSTTEEMCNVIREQIPNYDVIVVDSINNSASGEQVQKGAEERTMANRAITMAAQLPILVGLANQHNTTLFVLSQIRDNMNKSNKYSPDTVIPGGKSLHHNSSMTIELKSSTKKKSKDSDPLNEYENVLSRMVRMTCTKNKVGTPLRSVSIEFTYGEGYTIEADIASAAVRLGLIEKAGSWLKYNGTSISQGLDNLVPVLKDNPELLEELRLKILEKDKETNE